MQQTGLRLCATLVAWCWVFWALPAQGASAVVERLQDGDSFIARTPAGEKTGVRLYGIDAPELHQAFGRVAQNALRELAPVGSPVELEVMDRDRHGRVVAVVTRNGQRVQDELVAQGLAWVDRRHCKADWCAQLLQSEKTARAARKGLWHDKNPIPPWKWRAKNPRK